MEGELSFLQQFEEQILPSFDILYVKLMDLSLFQSQQFEELKEGVNSVVFGIEKFIDDLGLPHTFKVKIMHSVLVSQSLMKTVIEDYSQDLADNDDVEKTQLRVDKRCTNFQRDILKVADKLNTLDLYKDSYNYCISDVLTDIVLKEYPDVYIKNANPEFSLPALDFDLSQFDFRILFEDVLFVNPLKHKLDEEREVNVEYDLALIENEEGTFVKVKVIDKGKGISAENLEILNNGGLLETSRGGVTTKIMQENNLQYFYESEGHGKGTTVNIWIPIKQV